MSRSVDDTPGVSSVVSNGRRSTAPNSWSDGGGIQNLILKQWRTNMATIVLEHVKAIELPADWMKRVGAKPDETVRVTIVRESAATPRTGGVKPNRTFGMWADREDVGDAGEYVTKLRQPRYAVEK